MTEALRTAVEKRQRTALILWGGLTSAMALYAALAGFIIAPMLASGTPMSQKDLEVFVFSVAGLGIAMSAAAIVVYRAANSEQGMLKAMARTRANIDPAFNDSENRLLAVAEQIARSSMVATVLCDGVAVLGLALTLLSHRPDYVYVSAGIGVMISLLIMPRIPEAVELAEVLQLKEPR